jgi:hypothetical protein
MSAGSKALKKRRRGPGRPWRPGESGNPLGMARDLHPLVIEIRRLLLSYAPAAARRIVELVAHEDPKVSLAACEAVLDRAGVRAIAIDQDPQEGGGRTLIVQLMLPTREVQPSFLVNGGSMAALPAALETPKEVEK